MERPILARKEILNPGETIRYFALSQKKFYELIQREDLRFLAYYGTRKLIIRREFEKYLMEHSELRRRYSRGGTEKGQ